MTANNDKSRWEQLVKELTDLPSIKKEITPNGELDKLLANMEFIRDDWTQFLEKIVEILLEKRIRQNHVRQVVVCMYDNTCKQ
jgi:hypothetical protein